MQWKLDFVARVAETWIQCGHALEKKEGKSSDHKTTGNHRHVVVLCSISAANGRMLILSQGRADVTDPPSSKDRTVATGHAS
jgi:hypothetical protein